MNGPDILATADILGSGNIWGFEHADWVLGLHADRCQDARRWCGGWGARSLKSAGGHLMALPGRVRPGASLRVGLISRSENFDGCTIKIGALPLICRSGKYADK
jgi:hypothetical protein